MNLDLLNELQSNECYTNKRGNSMEMYLNRQYQHDDEVLKIEQDL